MDPMSTLMNLAVQYGIGDVAPVPEITGDVYRGHVAMPELALEQIALTEVIGQRRVDCGHRSVG